MLNEEICELLAIEPKRYLMLCGEYIVGTHSYLPGTWYEEHCGGCGEPHIFSKEDFVVDCIDFHDPVNFILLLEMLKDYNFYFKGVHGTLEEVRHVLSIVCFNKLEKYRKQAQDVEWKS
jgi:hypothetical protein